MATKAQCRALGCPDSVCDALLAKGLDLAKVFAVVQLVVSYIPKIKVDPKEMWNLIVELFSVFVPPAPTPAPMPMPAPRP